MYTVHIRDTLLLRNACSCDDFARANLGTCKHIEAVLLHLGGEVGCEIWQPDDVAEVEAAKPPPTGPVLFFDLETRRSFDEVGGRTHMEQLGVSVAVTQREDTGEFAIYEEDQCPALVESLVNARVVVGFNIVGFDYKVLAPWAKGRLASVPTIDMMEEAVRTLGHRISFDQLAKGTLGEGKSSHGMQAIEWWREGRLDLIIDYCRRDVQLVGLLYQYGKETGHLIASTHSGPVELDISWGRP
jgi:DEAD/DEAH box helicase domain-containing protein